MEVEVGKYCGGGCWVRFDDNAPGTYIEHEANRLTIEMLPATAVSLLEQLAKKLDYYPPEPRSNSGRRVE